MTPMSDQLIHTPAVWAINKRVVVNIRELLEEEESESGKAFREFLAALDKANGVTWNGNSLEGALLADDESAHVYAALMLPEYERWISTDPETAASVAPPHQLLWDAYRLGREDADRLGRQQGVQ